mgnify:CR=1 FL=1
MLSAADSCSEVALMDMSHYNKDYDTSHPSASSPLMNQWAISRSH